LRLACVGSVQPGGVTAPESLSAEALLSALEPYARTKRLARGLRLIDLHEPHVLTEPTRKLAADILRLLTPRLGRFGHGRTELALDNLFTGLDGVLLVLGSRRSDLRGWVAYTMLRVHRRPVMWLHAAAVQPSLHERDALRRALGYGVVREWLRHQCPWRSYIAGLAHHTQVADLRSMVPRGSGRWLRADAPAPGELDHVGEALARWVLNDPSRYGLAAQATFDAGAFVVRNAFGGEPADGERSDGQASVLGPHDASLMVVRASLGASMRARAPFRPPR
jgi:hypothetical protein